MLLVELFLLLPDAIGPEVIAVFLVFILLLAAVLGIIWRVFYRR
ncbi:MAG TPA: hypothetical protein VE288_00895 [Rubrobacteraceae bacterium]|jgi:hypothetical protein|nr:hypothetical protein [Rubrobacteraceae bacterium]